MSLRFPGEHRSGRRAGTARNRFAADRPRACSGNAHLGEEADLAGNAAQSIQFQTIDRGVDRYLVQGASCPQWHDFTGGTLYLRHSSGAPVTITLQRSLSPPGQQSG
jgi:hypothetical protein